MLYNIRIALLQKLALIGILSFSGIIMVYSGIRVAMVAMVESKELLFDFTWLDLGSNVEIAVGLSSHTLSTSTFC